jgi:2,4-dienoyl-CoA reductase-like NADH-dependent reductase (Old Yellow Enzyme family)
MDLSPFLWPKTKPMTTLFDPIAVGPLRLSNRIFMAPLTRARSTRQAVPTPMMVGYYAARADAGLIVSEATTVTPEGYGFPYSPGIWSPEQVAAWGPITAAVHAAGGRIVCQLWHHGRLAHPDLHGGTPALAPSAIAAPGTARTYEGKRDHVVPKAMTRDEIAATVQAYASGARNSMDAGFDGVEVHGANGYLIDQFLRDSSNQRDDDYGGSIESRIRFLAEVVDAVGAAVGRERTGVRLSPNAVMPGISDSDPEALFTAAARMLDAKGIAYLHLREARPDGTFGRSDVPLVSPAIRKVFAGPLVLNGDYRPDEAAAAVTDGRCDAIAFGRLFISNPDLVRRLRAGAPLNDWNVSTFYTQGPEGYLDYPRWQEAPTA